METLSGFLLSVLGQVLSLVILFLLVVLILLYIYLGMRDLVTILKNFNIVRADYCREGSCGFYYFDKLSGMRSCLNPLIGQTRFKKLSGTGDHKGCRWSMTSYGHKSPFENRQEYLALLGAFRSESAWWKIITVLLGLVLLQLGVIKLYEVTKDLLDFLR